MSRSRSSANRVTAIERLERRLLWAANLVPYDIHGLVLNMTITDSESEYSSIKGSFQFRPDVNAWTYTAQGSVSGSGTFSFWRGSDTIATLYFSGTPAGRNNETHLTFSSPTGGTFWLTSPDPNTPDAQGYLSGTFEVAPADPPLVSLSEGALTVNGTFVPDIVSIARTGEQIFVTENFFTYPPFEASDVTSMNIFLGDGADHLNAGAGILGFYCDAGTGNDSLIGGDGNDTLTGGAGKDTIDGGLGDDRLNGYGSNDHLIGNAGYDRLYGGTGSDFLEGGGGVDRIWAGDGDDVLSGGGSNDKLFGEAGNDSLYGGTGSDLLDGGDDTDLASAYGGDVLVNVP